MGNGITFVHSADLHMDSLFKTKGHLPEELLERLRAGTFEAFDRLIQVCINEQADFLLIAGDVYHEELRSLKAQVHVRRGFEKLQKHDIHVYVSFGNHDFTGGAEHAVSFPENVHVFQSEEVQAFPFYKEGERLAHIYGFSYETRAVKDHKAREFQKTGHPLYHIAMLHGSLETKTDHDVYAPFTLEELKNKGMDYWALGHIHKREVLSSDPAHYLSRKYSRQIPEGAGLERMLRDRRKGGGVEVQVPASAQLCLRKCLLSCSFFRTPE